MIISHDGLEYKQDSPRMQIAALLQSTLGHLHNIIENISKDPGKAAEVALDHGERALYLLKKMPEGDWKSFPELLKE